MTQRLRLVTWNINSLRLRMPLLARLVAACDPDVICLQETKVPDALFPAEGPAALGYRHVVYRGEKGYNGVAILSRYPLLRLMGMPDWCGRGDTRHIAVALDLRSGPVALHDFYVPAGGDLPDRALNAKFGHKLDFVAEATAWFGDGTPRPRSILVGDLNIAPLEHDVWSHRQMVKIVSHTPDEVAGLTSWQNSGFHDALRHFVPEEQKLYTWWSYRNRDWRASDRGRRLDHVWVTHDLRDGLVSHRIVKEARDWPAPSDHVPVLVEMEV